MHWGQAVGSSIVAPGTQVGLQRQVTITGLSPATQYDVRLVAFRGTLNVDAVFSDLSNIATGTTLARAIFAYVTTTVDDPDRGCCPPGVLVINTTSRTVVATVPDVGGAGVAVTPDGAFVYVGGSSQVSVIEAVTNTVVATIPVSGRSVAVTPDGAFVYVANSRDNTASVIATASSTVVATIPVDGRSMAVTPDGAFVYMTTLNAVSVIATATTALVATIPVGSYPYDVAVTPDGAFVYVTNHDDNTVSVIATASNTVVATIPVEHPHGVAITPDGAFAYVANWEANELLVIATATNTVVATVRRLHPYGGHPEQVAITPDGAFVYVTLFFVGLSNGTRGSVSVVAAATNTVVDQLWVGDHTEPQDIAITPAPNGRSR
jgi:YVTN family beta-propeller protein